MDQYIGKMLDNRYELLEIVGTGGMAVVYRAKCHRLNRFVAVKILKPEAARDPELRQRFRDESQAVAMLSHPNIVAVYDVSKTDNLEYIVMELIDGITLKQYIRQKGGALPWKEALHFITQVIRGLRHAHSRGIIHRDIKPHNIMVLRDGSCKVADFGIACLGNTQAGDTQEALGSVHYIAPEQAKGARVDARTDIYSAGVVLYEMLAGCLPYQGDSPVAVALQHMQTQPESPGTYNPNIPLGLDQITMKAMALKPSARYDSARTMLVDLDTLRKNPKYIFPYTVGKEPLTRIPKVSDEDDTRYMGAVSPAGGKVPTRNRPQRNRDFRAYTEAETTGHSRSGDNRKGKKSNRGPIILVVLAVLICICLAGCFVINTISGGSTSVTIPDLVGMQYDEAIIKYGDTYNVVIGGYTQDDSYAAGVILEQNPQANQTSSQSKPTITVQVCIHADSITMPDIEGYAESTALTMLAEAGVSSAHIIKGTSVYSDTIEEGCVVYTSPAAGTPLSSGDDVTYYLSKGADPDAVTEDEEEVQLVTVPDFVGSSRTQVLAQLKGLGLSGTFTEVENDADAGTVLSQSIAAGTGVEAGTVIDFAVSTGAVTTTQDTTESQGTTTEVEQDTQEDEEAGTNQEQTTDEEQTADEEQTTDDDVEDTSTDNTASTAVISVDRSYTVTLPSDYEEVSVTVKVGDSTAYSRNGVDTSAGSLTITISGSGTQTVSVYINGELQSSESVTFN